MKPCVPPPYLSPAGTTLDLIGGNLKTEKSDKAGRGYQTTGLTLAPSDSSGITDLCPWARNCKTVCLVTAGRNRFSAESRQWKTAAFLEDPDRFLARLIHEVGLAKGRAAADGDTLAVRLNLLSDVAWERKAPALFTAHPDVVWYDYTKGLARVGRTPENYHLTGSYDGPGSLCDDAACAEVLASGRGNVAVAFDVVTGIQGRREPGRLPATWNGYPVLDGDLTDLRFLDPPSGYVVGLRAKGAAAQDTETPFVVRVRQSLAVVPDCGVSL